MLRFANTIKQIHRRPSPISRVIHRAFTSGSNNVVENGDEVSVAYTGTLASGEQFDSSTGRDPLKFKVGQGLMISGFDKGVVGMSVNEKNRLH